jgi:hypothetical protein
MTEPASPARLPRWHELAAYLSLGLLALTGIAWLVLDRWVRVSGEFGPEHHPAQAWMLVLHGVVAYVFLLVAGMLVPAHILPGWRIGRNRKSGVTLVATCLLLAATALLLYYTAAEKLRAGASLLHWTLGCAATIIFLVHVIRGRSDPVSM